MVSLSALIVAFGFGCSSSPTSARRPDPLVGNDEPVYTATKHSLIVRDDFNQYANTSAMLNAYPVGRATEYMELTAGHGGSGGAARLKYGLPNSAVDILFGPETRLDRVGGWNGTLPQKAGPYTHLFLTTWFRPSTGADPAANNGSGIKGFMFWHTGDGVQGGRYQNAVNQLNQDGRTRGPKAANPDNSQSGLTLYRTTDGRAPLFSKYADGQWHRFTVEIFAGNDPSGHRGERYWLDGELIYDDIDQNVSEGTRTDHYGYAYPIRHWMVFGNFVADNARSPFFTFDIDDWMAWTD